MQLSKFFTLAEMTRSDTATRHGIANLPDETALRHLQTLCAAVLDPLREAVQSSIKVSSGYRGPELNARIGGAKKSQHMEGKAVDIQSSHVSVLDLFKTVVRLKLPFDQVIFEAKNRNTKWVHVSHDPARARGEILVAQFSADGSSVRYRSISAQEALDLADPIPATRSGAMIELAFEELADEPESGDEAELPIVEPDAVPQATPTPRATPKRRKSKSAPLRKPAKRKPAKRKSRQEPAKRNPAPKRKSALKRKTNSKRVRTKAKKHR
jgi:zinc D-Ala-D-Ala carboxypeptidase